MDRRKTCHFSYSVPRKATVATFPDLLTDDPLYGSPACALSVQQTRHRGDSSQPQNNGPFPVFILLPYRLISRLPAVIYT